MNRIPHRVTLERDCQRGLGGGYRSGTRSAALAAVAPPWRTLNAGTAEARDTSTTAIRIARAVVPPGERATLGTWSWVNRPPIERPQHHAPIWLRNHGQARPRAIEGAIAWRCRTHAPSPGKGSSPRRRGPERRARWRDSVRPRAPRRSAFTGARLSACSHSIAGSFPCYSRSHIASATAWGRSGNHQAACQPPPRAAHRASLYYVPAATLTRVDYVCCGRTTVGRRW